MRWNFFHTLSARRKISLLFLVITGTALILFWTLSSLNQISMLRKNMVANLDVLAGAIAQLSPSSLTAGERESAQKLLNALQEDEDIERAAIYNLGNEVFAHYPEGEPVVSNITSFMTDRGGHRFVRDNGSYKLEIYHPITQGGKRIGTMYLVSNLNKMTTQFYHGTVVLLITMIFIFCAAQILARRMEHLITQPIFSLASTARQISELGDYSVRVEHSSRDEFGELIDDFNTMLDAIQVRDSELHQHRHNLELLVEERTEELRNHRDEALAAAQAKAEFLANMSHEIRTPMNGVIGVLSLLKGAQMSEESRRLLETATRSADSLMVIIDDILDFSKIDAGMVELEQIPFDLRGLAEETVALFTEAVSMKGIDLLCYIPAGVTSHVHGDPTRLRQILTNMISNAIKFTSKGEVLLQIDCIEATQNKQLLRFSVKDTGIGIGSSSLPRLFEKFTQADGSTTRKYGGTGLGLSVCKKLVEMQGGDIGVTSRLDEGAEFWFILPFSTAPLASPDISCGHLENRRLLVVDDNAGSRMILEDYLQECGALVTGVAGGAEALDVLGKNSGTAHSFDTVLIDRELEGIDGLTLAGTIKERFAATAPRMLLMCYGHASNDSLAEAGIDAIIHKPVRKQQLYEKLNNRPPALEIQAKESGEYRENAGLSGKLLLVDDEPINRRIACAILEQFGLEVDMAENGPGAMSLLSSSEYDIVLMDIQMPEMSGYEATEIIRAREKEGAKKRTVIIAMTANAMESTRARCLKIGMDDFITKPIKPEVLAERLRPWLGGKRENKSPVARSDASGPDEPNQHVWNRERALQFVGGDRELLLELAVLFMKRHEKLLAAVEEAIRADDSDRLDDAAHAYKGAVNHFAADGVRKIALMLEEKGKAGEMTGTEGLFETLKILSAELLADLKRSVEEKKSSEAVPFQYYLNP